MKQPAIYMMSSKKFGTIYTGVTSDLVKRVCEHKNGITKGFVAQHKCKNLVCFEIFDTMYDAISREKQIKGGSRGKKVKLIDDFNSEWIDLYSKII